MIYESDGCERVASAIADGRFLEDPALWREHVVACETCSRRVEGLFTLRERLRGASLEAPIEEAVPAGRSATIDRAFARYHRDRRNGGIAMCVAVAALAGGAFVAWPRERAVPADPVAYAKRLEAAVFGKNGHPDGELLKNDGDLRAEYFRALSNPSSLVRRTALSALTYSKVPLEVERFEQILKVSDEDLEKGLEIAGTGDGSRAVSEALARRRTATLQWAVEGLHVQAAGGGERVAAEVLVPFLRHKDTMVREAAVGALSYDPAFVPGEEVLTLVRGDPEVAVRDAAARCLVRRLDSKGIGLVVDTLRAKPDADLEGSILGLIKTDPRAIELSKERLAAANTPLLVALLHAEVVLQSGVKEPPARWMDAALESASEPVLMSAASLAALGDWPQYRERFQAAWRATLPHASSHLAQRLVGWDVKAGGETRLGLALEICDRERDAKLRKTVTALSESPIDSVRSRAEGILRTWPE